MEGSFHEKVVSKLGIWEVVLRVRMVSVEFGKLTEEKKDSRKIYVFLASIQMYIPVPI